MRGGILTAILVLALLGTTLSGCGPDEKEQYVDAVVPVMDEWRTIVDDWNANPGDAAVATRFVSLEARAKAIKAPDDMTALHGLLLQAMDAERQSFEAYAMKKKTLSDTLHGIALKGTNQYQQALKNLGLLK